MSQEPRNIIKLTADDIPELAKKDSSTEGTCCCYWQKNGAGWKKLGDCVETYGSEETCRTNTPPAADAYSWSPYSC